MFDVAKDPYTPISTYGYPKLPGMTLFSASIFGYVKHLAATRTCNIAPEKMAENYLDVPLEVRINA